MIKFNHELFVKGEKVGVTFFVHKEVASGLQPLKTYDLGIFENEEQALKFIEKIKSCVEFDMENPMENTTEQLIDKHYKSLI